MHVAELALDEFLRIGTLDAAPAELFASLVKQHSDFVHFRSYREVL